VPPNLQSLPALPSITTATPAPSNAVAAPGGFDPANPDLEYIFGTLLPLGVPPVHARIVAPVVGKIVPPYHEIQSWDCRVRLVSEPQLLLFEQNARIQAPVTIRLLHEPTYKIKGYPIGARASVRLTAARGQYAITGRSAQLQAPPSRLAAARGTYSITGRNAILSPEPGKITASRGSYVITGRSATLVGPAAGYRYWRLNGMDRSILEISELQLLVGSTNQTSGTITLSHGQPETIEDIRTLLTDGNLFTAPFLSGGPPNDSSFWIKYDFGAGNEKEINGVKMGALDNSARYPTQFTLQYSSNDSSWTTYGSKTGLSYPGNNTLSSLYSLP
jgi:hypothetical protein